EELEDEITASIAIIYERKISHGSISEIHHDFGDIISTFLHAHIDENYCLEVIIVKGDAGTFRKLVDAFHTNENITQLKVSVLEPPKKQTK
ncbi:MAG: nickel-responsive transcriptional regulator NikR, partial [Candidatus Bathyarchaeum sp.]